MLTIGCSLFSFFLITSPFTSFYSRALSIRNLLSYSYFLACCSSFFIISAYNSAEAVIVAPMQYSQMIWAVIFGFLIFNEMPDRLTLVGAGVIMASGLYIVLRESRARVSKNSPVLESRSRHETGTLPRISLLLRREKGPK